jgi:hypothetical protein
MSIRHIVASDILVFRKSILGKKIMKKILIACCATLISCSTFAATVNFPAGQSNGTFSCTLSDEAATVKIDTDQVELNGACAGRPFVSSNGHLENVPAAIFKDNYFQATKHLHKSGKIELTASTGELTCSLGHGDKPNAYGDGQYCVKMP